jgi:hypothetical protein
MVSLLGTSFAVLAVTKTIHQPLRLKCLTMPQKGKHYIGLLTLTRGKRVSPLRQVVFARWTYKNHPAIKGWGVYDSKMAAFILLFSDRDNKNQLWHGFETMHLNGDQAIGRYVWEDGTTGVERCGFVLDDKKIKRAMKRP